MSFITGPSNTGPNPKCCSDINCLCKKCRALVRRRPNPTEISFDAYEKNRRVVNREQTLNEGSVTMPERVLILNSPTCSGCGSSAGYCTCHHNQQGFEVDGPWPATLNDAPSFDRVKSSSPGIQAGRTGRPSLDTVYDLMFSRPMTFAEFLQKLSEMDEYERDNLLRQGIKPDDALPWPATLRDLKEADTSAASAGFRDTRDY